MAAGWWVRCARAWKIEHVAPTTLVVDCMALAGADICSRLPEARDKLRAQYPKAAAMLDAPP